MQTQSIPKILLTRTQVANALSVCERTVSTISEKHFPCCRIGRQFDIAWWTLSPLWTN